MKFDLDILNKYINNKLIEVKKHPTYPIYIYNYTRLCQFKQKWDEITLQCRGLVLDKEGNILAYPFKKFFNIEEYKVLPSFNKFDKCEIYEKIDGSLGILFNYNNEWILCTRGSFTSDQAIKGKQILSKYKLDLLDKNYTYLLEIIYPENRIVVDYGRREELILIGINDTNSKISFNYDWMELLNKGCFPLVRKYDIMDNYISNIDFHKIKNNIHNNEEGYVIFIPSYQIRIKIKGEEYFKLHKILTNIHNTSIWEYLKNGDEIGLEKILENIPDEYDYKIYLVKNELQSKYKAIEKTLNEYWDNYFKDKHILTVDRKDFSEYTLKLPAEFKRMMFNKLNNKCYSKIIWNIIKPKNIEKII